MKTHRPIIRTLLCLALALQAFTCAFALTDISSTPLATSSPTQAKPNIFYVLDDSGSMAWSFLPDWATYDYSANDHSKATTSCNPPYASRNCNIAPTSLFQNSGYNGIYYNPAVTYTPPVDYSGSTLTYPSMTSWTSVPDDAYGVQTNHRTDLTQAGQASYYLFTAAEYCTDQHERTCKVSDGTDPAYTIPAYLRWCTDATLTNCQATRIDTGTSTQYTYARYPGYGAAASTTTLTITGNKSTSVSGIMVNGVQIMSAATTTSKNPGTLANLIANNIALAGYSATASSTTNFWTGAVTGIVTIVAPASAGVITYTPSVTQSGSMTIGVAPFAGGSNGVPGSNTQTIITPTTLSYWHPGTARGDCVDPSDTASTCTYAEEMTNYANWWAYYHTRMQMTKTGAALAFSSIDSNYRIGYMSINNNTGSDFLNINDATSGSTGQKAAWYAKFLAAIPYNGTGTRQALATAGLYYAGQLYGTKVNGVSNVNDPMQYSCQRNFTILSTDGYWNEGDTGSTHTDTPVAQGSDNTFNPYLSGIVTIDGYDIGDQDASLSRPYSEGTSTDGSTITYDTMADVAAYYYNNSIRTAAFGNAISQSTGLDLSGGSPNMSTSTMGLGASGFMQYQKDYATANSGDYYDVKSGNTAGGGICGWLTSGAQCNWPIPVSNSQTAVDDLWHAAVNGHGTYYSAQNPTDVRNGLISFLASVKATLGSSAGATVSSPNVTQTNNSQYLSTFKSQEWDGELAKYTIDATSGIAHTYADWSESGMAFASATTNTSPLLDLQDAAGTRNIYTYDVTANPSILTSFSWPSLSTTVQGYFSAAVAAGLSQWSSLSPASQTASTAAGTNNGAAGYNLVAYLAGNRSNEGAAGGAYYRQRTHILGDLVDSQPAYVTAPAYNYPDPGYASFATNNSTRASMVYVGANDGMLHAFNGANGAEAFAYIPSMVLPNLYHLADNNYASNHLFFVDGSPTSGDVCVANCSVSATASWKTILVGGLGDGGRGYYALDVTNPSNPLPLWEFTDDTTKTGGKYVSDQDLGLTYGKPVITKLSDGTWVVLVTSGYNNVSPGSGDGILYVLNANTGALIKKIDTGVGGSSGLAQIGAYAPTNNTTQYVYGGDLDGNLWRFDISNLKGDGTGIVTTQSPVTTQLLTTLKDNSSPGQPQPITTAPVTGNSGGNIVVFVGTGRFLGLSDLSGTSTPQTQSIYAIKDTLAVTGGTAVYASPRTNLCTVTSTTNCFVQNTLTDSKSGTRTVTSSIVANLGTMDGWFADLPETGERINTEMNLQLGILVFTSNIPGTGTACSAGGSSYLNYVNYTTGQNVPGQTSVGILLTTTNGSTALANSSTLTVGSSGQVIASTTLSNGNIVVNSLGQTGSTKGTRRISWRELMTN